MVFPNSKSLQSYIKRDWTHQKNYINYYLKPVFSLKLLTKIFDIKKDFIPNNADNKYNFKFYDFNNKIYSNVFTSFWSIESLNWRFNEMPQAEYCHAQLDSIESIGRIGKRGELVELQIIYINLKTDNLNNSQFRKIISYFKTKIKPDLISFPISIYNPYKKAMFRNGFLKINSNTNFVYKSTLKGKVDSFQISLSGIDFHTY